MCNNWKTHQQNISMSEHEQDQGQKAELRNITQ